MALKITSSVGRLTVFDPDGLDVLVQDELEELFTSLGSEVLHQTSEEMVFSPVGLLSKDTQEAIADTLIRHGHVCEEVRTVVTTEMFFD